mmetsp:Transcript_27324/g.65669  ORF Transcript_27324/g.65669 Transcript_27324/m.65669 type:complete len:166 (+) Transcript_27324:108-605(+)
MGAHRPAKTSTMNSESMVEARVLTLFLIGLSGGSADRVRLVALDQLMIGAQKCVATENGKNSIPWRSLIAYFPSMLEIMLDSCSRDWAPCQSKVRSLGGAPGASLHWHIIDRRRTRLVYIGLWCEGEIVTRHDSLHHCHVVPKHSQRREGSGGGRIGELSHSWRQ